MDVTRIVFWVLNYHAFRERRTKRHSTVGADSRHPDLQLTRRRKKGKETYHNSGRGGVRIIGEAVTVTLGESGDGEGNVGLF